MEKMPFRDAQEVIDVHAVMASAQKVTTSDWRQALPVLTGSMVTLRELRLSDAPALLAMLSTEEVARFISPPPTTVEGFERFIAWTHRERAAGNYVCFAVVPHNMDTAIGIFQVRQLEPGFGTAEWGFAIGSSFWGTGDFPRRRHAGRRLRVRSRRHASARGSGRDGERPWQRRAAQGWRRSGGRASQVVPARRRVSRSNPVDDPRRRLAPQPVAVEADDPLTGADRPDLSGAVGHGSGGDTGMPCSPPCFRCRVDTSALSLCHPGLTLPRLRPVRSGEMKFDAVFPPMATVVRSRRRGRWARHLGQRSKWIACRRRRRRRARIERRGAACRRG